MYLYIYYDLPHQPNVNRHMWNQMEKEYIIK